MRSSHTFNFSLLVLFPLFLTISACQPDTRTRTAEIYPNLPVTVQMESGQSADGDVYLRIAFLGDAEPKPLAEFPNMRAAIEQLNTLHETSPLDLIIGVGDIAHEGTDIQYEASTIELQKLTIPFYPIMGNEEHNESVDTYLEYAAKWNPDVESTRYVLEFDSVAFVLASPDYSREFNDEGVFWIRDQLTALAPKPVMLIVHGAQAGAYPENPEKGIHNPLFVSEVISKSNLIAVISGDLHMDMERVNHSKQIGNIHYLHIPGVERTKIPDETNHSPMFRVISIARDGQVSVDTYALGELEPREKLAYTFEVAL